MNADSDYSSEDEVAFLVHYNAPEYAVPEGPRLGWNAWQTIRPRFGINSLPRDFLHKYVARVRRISYYWIIRIEKTGPEAHIHCCMFLKESYGKHMSNWIRGWGKGLHSPLHSIYEVSHSDVTSEWYNFKKRCNKQMYNTDLITHYLSPSNEDKSDDYGEFVSVNLPADYTYLKPWLTDLSLVGKDYTATDVNPWHKSKEQVFLAEHPEFVSGVDNVTEEYLSAWYNSHMYSRDDFKIFRTPAQGKIDIINLKRYINKYTGPGYGSFSPQCRIESSNLDVADPVKRTLHLELKRKEREETGAGKPSFIDEDRDWLTDNCTERERKEHSALCYNVS